MTELNDVELLQRTRRGDDAAFLQLFTRHQRAIYRYATYMCGREAADDIVQETFLAVLQQRMRHDLPESAVISYLIGIARHRILKRVSDGNDVHSEEFSQTVENHVAADQPTPLDDLARAETIQRVRAAVESLPEPYREAVVLCELSEMDYAVAADVIGCPIGTVRSRLHRAKALLADKLGANDRTLGTSRNDHAL